MLWSRYCISLAGKNEIRHLLARENRMLSRLARHPALTSSTTTRYVGGAMVFTT
jgi:hypothetical protein